MASLNQYLYSTDEDTIYTHLYISGEAGIKIAGGEMRLKQESSYPWDGHIKFTVLSRCRRTNYPRPASARLVPQLVCAFQWEACTAARGTKGLFKGRGPLA